MKPGLLISVFLVSSLAGDVFAANPSPASGAGTLSPADAQQELEAGNQRYMKENPASCANASTTRRKLTESQSPDAIVLSCSDSRVPPEQVFDQGLGKLFVIRVAGNVLSSDAIASIEYAVTKLGTRLVVIMGHESCGAVKAAIETPAGKDAGSPSLNLLLGEIRRNLGNSSAAPAQDAALRGPVKKNVSAVADSLASRSKIVNEAIKSGQVRIVRAIYDLDTGKVEFWD